MTGPAIVNFLLERRACRDRSRRDLLVRSATYRLIIHPDATGTTSAPLQFTAFGGTRLSRPRNTLPAGLT